MPKFLDDIIVDGGSKVGIGTTSPAKLLHIDNPSGSSAMLLEGAGGYGSEILFRTNPASGQGWLLYDYSANVMAFGVNGTEAMRIDSSQRVGIGHTTFYQKFTVNGNIDIRGGNGCLLTFNNGDGGIGVHYNNTGTVGRDIAIKTYEAGVGNTEKMRVTKDGLVGIGTTSPSAKLHVAESNQSLGFSAGMFVSANPSDYTVGRGSGITFKNADVNTGGIYGIREANNWTGSLAFYTHTSSANNTFGSTFTEKMRITSSGDVGIGTTSPNASYDKTLHILGTNPTIRIETSSDTGWAYNQYESPQGTWSTGIAENEQYRICYHDTLGSGHAKFTLNTSGDATFAGSITIPQYINHTGDGNTNFGFGGADDFRVTVGGTKRLNVHTGGVEITGNLTGGTNATFTGAITGTTITSTVNSTTGRIRAGVAGQLHLGDDSDIISVGRTNELWTFADVDSDQTLYVNYRGYNNGSSRFRSLDIRDGKAGSIALFNGTDKSTTFAGAISTPSSFNFTGNNGYIKVGSSWNTGVLHFLNGATTYLQFDVPNGRIQNNLGSYLTASSGTAKFGSFDNQSMSLVTNNTARLTVDTSGNATFTKDIVLSQGSYYFRNASDSTQRHGFVADHVYEFNQLDLQINAGRKLYLDGGSNSYITESSADNISFFTGGTERLKIDNNGQILASWRFISEATTTNSLFQAKYNSTNFLEIGYNFINVQGGDYTLKRGGTERIKVTASGIEVNGEVQVTGDIRNINSYQQGTVSAANPAMKAVLLAHSTESNGAVIHPYLFNDLANFRKRGGTITYGGLSSNPSDAASDIMFQASALTCSINNGVITGSTWTIELKDFPRTLFYGTRIGISFGSVSFAPSSMLVQYSSDNGANYTTALTSSVRSEYYHTYVANGGSGTGINAIKFTIGKFNTHSPRVMNIYAYNYDSRGMTEYFLDKAGGTLYGNLTMNSAGFTLDGNTITGIDNASEFTDDDNHIMTSAAIKNKIADNDNNFITASALPTDFVSAANGGTFAGNVAFTGNITANGNINGDGSTNVGNMNNVTAVKLLANGLSLKIGDQQGASITMGKEPTVVSGVTQNDATDVVIANNLTVTKKLLIQGELETETTTNTVIKDNVIQLNDGGNSANTKDSGIVIHRGTSQNVAIVWDEDGQTAGGAFRFIATGDTASSADVSMTPQNELGENVIGGASALGFQDVYAAHFRAVGAGNTSGFVGDGSGVTNLNMGNASSGTLAAARGGTGLSSISTLLNSNVTSVSGSSGSCTGNAATATAFSTTLGLTTVSMTFQLAANTWTDTGINSSDLTSGTYAMQVYVDDHNAGGLHYDEYYSATISWFGGTTNSSNHDEIVTHNAGHANNNSHVQFRTLRHTNPGDNLMLQVKQNFAHSLALNGTDGKTMTFKFRRLI